jgi:probable HAF family extracellular repeat protein
MTRALAVVVVVVLLAAGCARQSEPAVTFTELSFPGSTATAASGINDAGHVVGTFWKADRAYGFVYRDGEYTSIDYPNSLQTQLHGISRAGEIVGSFGIDDGGGGMGFLGFIMTASGEFREVRHPDFRYGMAMGIAADGSVVGCYHNDDGIPSMRGMAIPAHAFTDAGVMAEAVDILDTPTSMHNGVAPDGTKIVGMLSGEGRGYVIDHGVLTHIDVPDARRTEAWDVNSSGAVVGVYLDPDSVRHGFLLEDGRFTTIHVPGAKSTSAFGINGRGEIVGAFETVDGQRRGYIATRPSGRRG